MNLSSPTADSVVNIESYTPDQLKQIDDYLAKFVISMDGKCVWCRNNLAVDWSLCHGETNCIECGYGSRTYHYIKIDDKEIGIITRTLQYHPNGLYVSDEE